MIVVVNASAHGGRGRAIYERLAPELAERWPHQAVFPEGEAAARQAVIDAALAGEAVIASASGDGGVHLLVNTLMDPATDAPRWPVAVGAIGLGSSNDFHKPRQAGNDVQGVPVALDPQRGERVDLGRVDFRTPDGAPHTEYFVLNSSFGAVAEGNARYNQPSVILSGLKRISVGAAIQWCTLETMAGFRNVPARVEVDGEALELTTISTLGVIKRVHFAGDLRYDTPVTPADGQFDVNLAHDMNRIEMIRAMLALSSGKFLAAGLPKTLHRRATRVHVVPAAPAALELDGEVRQVVEATFRVIPQALQLCGGPANPFH